MPLHDVGLKYIADDATIQDTCIKRGGEGRGERKGQTTVRKGGAPPTTKAG